jgi:hypothetical protein
LYCIDLYRFVELYTSILTILFQEDAISVTSDTSDITSSLLGDNLQDTVLSQDNEVLSEENALGDDSDEMSASSDASTHPELGVSSALVPPSVRKRRAVAIRNHKRGIAKQVSLNNNDNLYIQQNANYTYPSEAKYHTNLIIQKNCWTGTV